MNDADIQRAFRDLPGLFLVLRADAGFTIVAASNDYLRATYADHSIFGRSVFEVFPDNPADPAANGVANLRASLGRVIATRARDTMALQRYDVRAGEIGRFEERYWHPVNSPILDEKGEVAYIVVNAEDATGHGEAWNNRNAIEILESITEGFFTLDREWRFDFVNREAHRILGRTPGDLTGKVLWEVYPGLEGTEFERSYHRTMSERLTSSFTAFYPNHNRWYEVTTFPARSGISVYFRDVTPQKETEAERERLVVESERQRRIYEAALDNTPDFVYVFDLEHRALYANDALLKTWGVDDVRGKKWMDLGYEQWHADMHDRELDTVISTRAPIRGEIPFTGTSGRRVYDYIFAPVFGPQGDVVAVAGTTRDVTERQSNEQAMREQAARLAQSDRVKDEFLATLAHELRNPLAPLRSSIALLRMKGADEAAAPVHAMMERQVNHLVRLVDDLLEMSRISRGTFVLRNEKVELAAVVRNAVETSEPLLRAGGHALSVQLPPQPVWLDGDPVRLAQILSNVLNNAAKYTDAGGKIVLHARPEDGQAVISVTDNGRGIAPEAMTRMFEMFSRGDRDASSSQDGLGIGLALSRRLAQMHGGSLDARSEGVGKGSEFTLRLPIAAGAANDAGDSAPAQGARLARTRLLVVDDNRDAADSLCMVLGMLGAEVRVAHDGEEALKEFDSYDPSVVLLDIGMPGMNGYDVARAIRGRYPKRNATLVALTGWGQEDDRRRAREAGFDHHLVKPAELGALRELLASLEKASSHIAGS